MNTRTFIKVISSASALLILALCVLPTSAVAEKRSGMFRSKDDDKQTVSKSSSENSSKSDSKSSSSDNRSGWRRDNDKPQQSTVNKPQERSNQTDQRQQYPTHRVTWGKHDADKPAGNNPSNDRPDTGRDKGNGSIVNRPTGDDNRNNTGWNRRDDNKPVVIEQPQIKRDSGQDSKLQRPGGYNRDTGSNWNRDTKGDDGKIRVDNPPADKRDNGSQWNWNRGKDNADSDRGSKPAGDISKPVDRNDSIDKRPPTNRDDSDNKRPSYNRPDSNDHDSVRKPSKGGFKWSDLKIPSHKEISYRPPKGVFADNHGVRHVEPPRTYHAPRYESGYYRYSNYSHRPCHYGFWAFNYSPGFSRRSAYYHFGFFPYVVITRVYEASYPTVVYVDRPVDYNGGYYLVKSRYSDVDYALEDIRSAWLNGRTDLIERHVNTADKLAIFIDGEYDYSIEGEDYLDMTIDAIGDMNTVSFVWNRVRARDDDSYTAFATHKYCDDSGEVKTVYVSYTLEEYDGEYYITEVGSSLDKLY